MKDQRPVSRLAVVAVAALLAIPLVVAAVQVRTPTWNPVLDLAMTELRVRDVGTSETPLIGLPGRIGETLEEQGSHPGPLSFYALAPTYRLLGSSSWAMQVGSAVIHLVAIGVALALARRLGGLALFSGVAVVVAVLVAGLGSGALTEPWNPYLPLFWWVVLLLAVWSVLSGDVAVLPVAALAGSFCAQTHVPYLSLSVGLGGVAALWVLRRAVLGPRGTTERHDAVRALALAGVVGVLLWLPPTLDQLTEDPGNYATLVDHFTTPPDGEDPIGVTAGAEQAVERLDLWHLGSHAVTDPALLTNGSPDRFPSATRGALVLLVWLVAAVLVAAVPAFRERRLLALHAVSGTAFLLGFVSITRIFGLTWFYLMLWMWAVGALMAVAVVWTVGHVAAQRRSAPLPARPVVAALVAVALVVTVHTTAADAVDAEPSDAEVSDILGRLVPDTIAALERGDGPSTGRDGRYQVAWMDAIHPGSQAYGLVSELERAGFDAGMEYFFHVPITDHRVIADEASTARLILASGQFVEDLRADPAAIEVAFVDPRSSVGAARFDRLRTASIASLEDLGLDRVIELVDRNLFAAAVDPSVPEELRRQLDEMLFIGAPTAVFVLPPEQT